MAIEKNLLGLLVFVISFWQEEIKKLLVLNKLYILLFDENTPHDSSKSAYWVTWRNPANERTVDACLSNVICCHLIFRFPLSEKQLAARFSLSFARLFRSDV